MFVDSRTPSRIATISPTGFATAAVAAGVDEFCCAGATLTSGPEQRMKRRESANRNFFIASLFRESVLRRASTQDEKNGSDGFLPIIDVNSGCLNQVRGFSRF